LGRAELWNGDEVAAFAFRHHDSGDYGRESDLRAAARIRAGREERPLPGSELLPGDLRAGRERGLDGGRRAREVRGEERAGSDEPAEVHHENGERGGGDRLVQGEPFPSLGHHLQIEKIRDEFRQAQNNPSQQNSFRRLRLDQWVGRRSGKLTELC
jgi:hypothetical protein